MKTNVLRIFFAFILGTISFAALSADFSKFTSSSQMCWLETSTRGVGTIPSSCPANYKNVLGVCWQSCPEGYRDDGAFCRMAEYGRGAGYPWKFGDPAFNYDKARDRCQKDNPQGCDKDGLIYYPKCKAGFEPFGCCICKPKSTACPLGMTAFAGSCTKKTEAASCGAGKQNDAGLCYNACPATSNGIGPVCWGKCPPHMPFSCAAGCTKDRDGCMKAVTEQVLSVALTAVKTAGIIASLGTATPAVIAGSAAAGVAQDQVTKAVDDKKTSAKAVASRAVKAQVAKAKEAIIASGKDIKTATVDNIKTKLSEVTSSSAEALKAADQIKDMVQNPDTFDFSSLDPVGVTQIIKAFNKPICNMDSGKPAEKTSSESTEE